MHPASIFDVGQSVRLMSGDIINPFYQRVGAGANEMKTGAGSYAGTCEKPDHPNNTVWAGLEIKRLSKQDR
jgi:hypothetical protein